MPELPEVERARSLLAEVAEGQIIEDVQTYEDSIVYTGGIDHSDFVASFKGRTIDRVLRKGKQAYFTTRDGPSGLFHLGMSGQTMVKNAPEQLYYRKLRPADLGEDGEPLWPPRYVKLVLKFANGGEWAFTDSRRLGRLRIVDAGVDPLTVPPLSLLGRDAFYDLPTLEELTPILAKRTAAIKAVLLDQNGPLAGIGNYLIDEICYQSRIHPAQRASTLNAEQLKRLHEQIKTVIDTAVAAKADYRAFPKNWLFNHRWGKGKSGNAPGVDLPDGQDGTVTFMTVGGRTSAVVESVQVPPADAAMVGATKPGKAKGSPYKGNNRLKPSTSDVDSDEDVLEAVEENKPSGVAQVVTDSTPKRSPSRRAKRSASSTKSPYFEHDSDAAMSSELSDVDDEAPSKKKRRTPAKSGKTGADPTSSAKRRRVTKAS